MLRYSLGQSRRALRKGTKPALKLHDSPEKKTPGDTERPQKVQQRVNKQPKPGQKRHYNEQHGLETVM
jgi:hypothetical protein